MVAPSYVWTSIYVMNDDVNELVSSENETNR